MSFQVPPPVIPNLIRYASLSTVHSSLCLDACVKIYKYRDFANASQDDFRRLEDAVHRHLVWCARPDTLNDPEEFIWQCDYTATPATLGLLTAVLVKARGWTPVEARAMAAISIEDGRLETIARPVLVDMITQCRNEIGIACFGTEPDNEVLWERYGGRGACACIEFDVPNDLLGTQLHRVKYLERKHLHVDQLLRAYAESSSVKPVYDLALLSKPSSWAPEEEVRFVSQRHSIAVALDRARVSCMFLGDALSADVRERIGRIASPIPLADRRR